MKDRSRTYQKPSAAGTEPRQSQQQLRPGAVRVFSTVFLFLAFVFILSTTAPAATPPNTTITNTAAASYTPGTSGTPVSVNSNAVSVVTTVRRTPSTIELLQYAPTAPGNQQVTIRPTEYSTSATAAGPFVPSAPPVPPGSTTPIDISNPVPLIPATQYHVREPVFIRLTDLDQNTEPFVVETVLVTVRNNVTGDIEVLRLTETGPNTGVFTGFIQTGPGPAANGNGILNVVNESNVLVAYTDIADPTDARNTFALVDPYGMVFNSLTGQPVDGASVTIYDAATGLPATVYGDDGISSFPATVTTGGTAMDSSGAVYTFTSGGFRFPFITPGRYRFAVNPPAGYRAPSVVPTANIQTLPGGPFAIVDPGSRGEEFLVNPGPAIHIDIPVDPVGTGLYVQKSAGKAQAAVGDFVPYRISVENTDTAALMLGVTVTDRLPMGFRYQKGSVRVNGASASDPTISADGRSITFSIGDLGPAGRAEIFYVAAVGAGAKTGNATNTAQAASATGATSNIATATVQIIEDLFQSNATIVGRVAADGCGNTDSDKSAGLEGVRVFLENGSYAVTDKNGMFHFAAVQPGTHVVQLDLASIPERYEIVECEENTRFAGSAFSQFVDLPGGALWRADFHLALQPKTIGEVGIELRSSLPPSRSGLEEKDIRRRQQGVAYAVPIHIGTVPVRNMRLTILLPENTAYIPGSAKLDAVPIADPEVSESALTFRLGDAPADWEGTVRFDANVPSTGEVGRLLTRAVLVFDTPEAKNERTPMVENVFIRDTKEDHRTVPDIVLHPRFPTLSAEQTKKDKQELNRVIKKLHSVVIKHITVTGHTDSHQIRGRGMKKFKDNYVLSLARAKTIADQIAKALNLKPEQITIVGKGPDEPVADNRTAKGRALNRRVELQVETESVIVFSEVRPEVESSGMKAVATVGLRPGEAWPSEKSAIAQSAAKKTMPAYDAAWLASAEPGTEWIWPPDGNHPAIANTKIAIKHDPAITVELIQNGEPVDGLYFDGTIKKDDGTVAVSVWRGIHLVDGDNRFEAVLTDASGAETGRLERTLHYSGPPVKAVLVPERSRLISDGRTPAVIAVRLFDREGHPAREGLVGEYTIDPPYLPKKRIDDLQQSPIAAQASDRLRYEVTEDGIALIELAPTSQTGEAVVRFPLANGEQVVRAWMKPEMRDWILVGLAEGTVGYNTVSGNMETLAGSGAEDRLYQDGRLAFYAKGMIKGEWLLTLAYDSAKGANGQKDLFQTIDPNKYYVLYGDASEQQFDAPSSRHIYVKLERDQFYALFGDYATGLTVTELSRYSRNFTGVKSEYKGEHGEFTVFASDTNQAFVKDEIRGDGTSGLYHLSRKNIVLNSETIVLETRDRFRSEIIVSTQRLARHLDYTIDYEAGTLFFKYPVFSTDGNFNPIYIVATYESLDARDNSTNYGGRGALRFLENRVEVGATHVHEGRTGGSGDLTGVDTTVKLSEHTKLRAEIAETKTNQLGTETDGTAYLAELTHQSPKMDGRVYIREQETGFGLGQQNGSETGTRKYGFDLTYRFTDTTSVRTSAFRQETFSTGSTRDIAEIQGRYATSRYEYFAGLRHAEDTFSTGDIKASEQVFAGLRYRITERLTFRAQHDQTVADRGGNSSDYPTRTTVGADYQLTRTTTIFADQEVTKGTDKDTATTRAGFRASPWTGAQIGSTIEEQTTENGTRLFATTGLKQAWQIDKHWSVDAGLDRSATFRKTGDFQPNPNVPPASGGEDFTAVTFGAGYKAEKWAWTGRAEARRAESYDKYGLYTGANGEPRPGIGLAAMFQGFWTDYTSGMVKNDRDLRLGAAYRPINTKWILLDRLDYVVAEQRGTTTYNNWRVVNNLNANYKVTGLGQASIQYGAKYVEESIEDGDYRGYTDLTGLELRYDVTKKLDVGLRGSRLWTQTTNQTKYGSALSVGFTMAKNFWLSVGYNITGFHDRDFSKADFTAEGPFIKLRMKFDQTTAREAIKWFTGQ